MLSDIIEKRVAPKYFLSNKRTKSILRKGKSKLIDPATDKTANTVQASYQKVGNRHSYLVAARIVARKYRGENTHVEYRKDQIANALTKVSKDSLLKSGQALRRFTPTECERLQGFPDGWSAKGIDEAGNAIEISDSQRYSLMGNAVSVPVVKAIAKKLKKSMSNSQSLNGLAATSDKQLMINAQVRELIDRKLNSFTDAEKDLLRKYQGGGGSKASTAQETLFEFFTPLWLVEKCWQLAHHYGYDGGSVIEPSCATGNFFHHAPDQSNCVGFELNHYSARIAEVLYPNATIHNQPFETAFMQQPVFRSLIKGKTPTWLAKYPFSLAIGNPPFGNYAGLHASMMKKKKMLGGQFPFNPTQFEIAFIMLSLSLLKKGGLLLFILPQAFLRNGDQYQEMKAVIGLMADFVDAYRLPPVFEASQVPTDILILRRK